MNHSPQRVLLPPLALAVALAVVWVFPSFWYTNRGSAPRQWLAERTELPGWKYRPVPVDQSAEKILVADRMVNGEFKSGAGAEVRVFSAKRYDEKANEIGLFIHTPDRCWIDSGWRMEPESEPTVRLIELHGMRIQAERRIYRYGELRELVYFFGLQDGQPLPYRLDHYLSTGRRSSGGGEASRDFIRATDLHFWGRLWDSFKSRREVRGPKQFVRISTALGAEDVRAADERLEKFLHEWLVPGNYDSEKAAWQMAAAQKSTDRDSKKLE